ncbi:hypothetical protein [Cellulomonas sp. Marseille-Q8402]
MTRLAEDVAADSPSVHELAEKLTSDPGAHYDGAVPDDVGTVARGVLSWGVQRPGGARRHRAAVTLERLS